jgi:hypothetical protein
VPRLHLIEIHEQQWCPAIVRDALRGVLQQAMSRMPGFEFILEDLLSAMDATGTTEVLDLCAGSGGPWVRLYPLLASDPRIERVRQTDLYPDLPAMEAVQRDTNGLTIPHAEPVDAIHVPPELPGLRTLFSAFHHFEPARARRILASAVADGRGIGIFEVAERSAWVTFFCILTAIPLTLALVPFIRPFRWPYVLFTYVLPIIPLLFAFDGVVSCLRAYTPEELLAMGREVGPDYEWKAGRRRLGAAPLAAIYLVGIPRRARGSRL